MRRLLQLTLFQIKDKLDFSWVKSKKTLIQTIVFGLLKFIIVAAISFAVLFLLTFVGFINKYDAILPIFTLFLTLVIVLNLLSATHSLMKSLYYSDDNKVLITFPVTSNQLFFSKLLVYLIFEIKKSLSLLIPGILGFLIFEIMDYKTVEVTFWVFLWMIIPILILVVIQVLFAAVFSIPFMYIYRLFKRYPVLDLVVVGLLIIAGLILAINLIALIPEDIDLNVQWPTMVNAFESFVVGFDRFAYPVNFFARVFFGEATSGGVHYVFNAMTFIKTAIAVGAIVLLGLIAFFLIRPFYFRMIYQTFEFDKNQQLIQKKNIRHKKYVTFANKEFKLSFRDFDISGSYLAIYIIVPVLLFFMNRVFAAISTSLRGNNIVLAINVLLTILPLLASNSTIATLYSKEGRTAYVTKTNPVNPFVPLVSKLLFNLLFSIPSIVACAVIFANFSNLGIGITLLFSVAVLLIQYAHIFFCAAQDLMNPQNEVYATTGSDFNNPNETKATIAAFIASFLIAIVFYFMLGESYQLHGNYLSAFIRLLIIAIFLFAGFLYLFIAKIRAFYFEK